ncbi:MAG: hypothetical protein IKU09_03325 [Firmicutes bacterium]|nr:hypothetical protein [Bacillota bacterium]
MKNKAPLALIELTIMVLIFAVSAALCLQAFVWSDMTSSEIAERDSAILHGETVAEVVKACCGDFDAAAGILDGENSEGVLRVYFDGELCAQASLTETENPLLGMADIAVTDEAGQEVFALTVCWQEVDGHE